MAQNIPTKWMRWRSMNSISEGAVSNRTTLLRETLILIIAGSILLSIAIFTFWLYYASKRDVNSLVESRLSHVNKTTELLSNLKKKEMEGIANVLVTGPILNSALSTRHKETIEDVLENVRAENKLAFVLVIDGKSVAHTSEINGQAYEGQSLKELVAGHFLGAAKVRDGRRILLGHKPDLELLADWKEITGADYQLRTNDGQETGAKTGGPEKDRPYNEWDYSNVTEKGKYYRSKLELLKGTLKLGVYLERAQFWKNFLKRRNSLLIIGGIIFFFGLLLAITFAYIFEKYLLPRYRSEDKEHFRKLIQEIEEAKKMMKESA